MKKKPVKKKPVCRPPKTAGLTLFQKKFIEEYLANPVSGTEAARKAGSKAKEPWKTAYQLLHNPLVIEAIEDRRNELGDDGQKPERALKEIENIGFSNIQRLFTRDGELIAIKDLPPKIAASIASIELVEQYEGRGKARKFLGYLKKIKLWDKPKALDMLCRIHGMYNDKVEIPGLQEFLEAMTEIDGNTKGKLPS